jgi:exopolysaccharide production protein ExoZ
MKDVTTMLTNLQILRFLAALEVLLLHSFADLGEMGFQKPFGHWLAGVGGSGVDLFFVISGFVIQRSLDRKPRGFADFGLDRIKRIAPVYWLATTLMTGLIFMLSVAGSKENAPAVPVGSFLASMSFTSQLWMGEHPVVRPGWSLEFEMFFYVAFSIALFLRRGARFATLMVFLLGLCVASGHLFVFEFALGIAVSRLTILKKFGNWNLAFAVFGVSLIGFSGSWGYLDNLWKWGLPGALLVIGMAYSKQVEGQVWLRLGRISYPLYVFHVLVISIVKWPFLQMDVSGGLGWLAIGVFVAASISIALLVDSYFDRPLQKAMSIGIQRRQERSNTRTKAPRES